MATVTARPPVVERVQLRTRQRFSLLLVAEFALIVGCPILREFGIGPPLWGILAIAVFVASLFAVLGQGRATDVAVVLAVPAIIGAAFNASGYTSRLLPPGMLFGTAFIVYTCAVILRSVITTAKVTIDTLYGAIAAYVLLGISWGNIYFLIETFWPSSFTSPIMPGTQIDGPNFIFFSFVTLTTIGYGDIVPASAISKSFVILEAVTGIMYPAVMIARLIALHSANPEK